MDVVQDIHEINIGVVGGFVGGEVFLGFDVGPVLGGHVVKVVAGGQAAPVIEEGGVAFFFDGAFEFVEFVEGVGLHGVAEPGGEVFVVVDPGGHVGDVEIAGGFVFVDDLGRGEEFVVGVAEDVGGEVAHEIEDAGVGPLVFAEGFEVHEEVADEAVAVDLVDPVGEFFGGEGPLGPGAVGEAGGDVVGEAVVFEEEFGFGGVGGAVDEVGGAEAEDVVGTFGEEAVVAHVADEVGEVVVVDEFGVAEDARFLAEELFDFGAVEFDLGAEFVAGVEEGEGVVVGFVEEFDVAGVGELFEVFDDFWGVFFELFEG